MIPSTSAYRLTPVFFACLRWAFAACTTIVIVVFLMVGISRLVQGLPLPNHWSGNWSEKLTIFLALTFGMALVIYGVTFLFGASLSGTSLTAVSFWGRRIEVPLSTVTEIRSMSIEGVPTLLVKSSATKSDLHVFLLGLDRAAVYDRLYEAAGPTHPLTIWFAPHES